MALPPSKEYQETDTEEEPLEEEGEGGVKKVLYQRIMNLLTNGCRDII